MANNMGELKSQSICYFCDSPHVKISRNRRQIYFGQLRKYFQCDECRAYSLFPKLNDIEIVDLYSSNYIEDVNSEFKMGEQITINRFLQLSESLVKVGDLTSKSFLDYGCGATAEVVMLASKIGYESFGVEVEAGTREEAKKRSNCQIFSPAEVQTGGVQFDVIFLGDVLEHLCDPLIVLNQIQKILAPDGLLIIQGPLEGATTFSNFLLSIKARLLAKSPSNFPPYHVSLATKESVIRALKINNLTIHELIVTEPLWPAPRFGRKASFVSITALIFSLAKILDMTASRILPKYGTRFFLTACKS